MKVIVLSDTHAPRRWRSCPPAVAAQLRGAALILHAGDVCTAGVLDELAGYAPVRAVRGNNDGPDVAAWGAPDTLELDLDGLRVAMIHDAGPAAGRPARMRRRFPAAGLVVFGHSHIPLDQAGGGQRIFNPGSPTDRRRQPRGTLGVLDVQAGGWSRPGSSPSPPPRDGLVSAASAPGGAAGRMPPVRMPPGPLRSRNFRLLLACDVISTTGTAVAIVALPFAVLRIGGSASDVGYVAAAYLVPMIGFLLVGGVVADRLPRHQVMVAANTLQALAQAASAVLVLTGQARVWELAGLAAARGVGTGFYFPAAEGLLPHTVLAGQRAPANAMDRIGRNGGLIGGSALGGVLVGLAGPGWGLAADAVSFAVAAALRAGMRFPALPSGPRTGMLPEMREGWRDFISRRWLWVIVVQFAFNVAIVTGTQSVLGPLVAEARLGGARSWGVILAADGIGAVLGGLVMIRFRPRRMLLAASLAVPADSVFLLALAVPLPVAMIAAAAFLAAGAWKCSA